MPSFLSQTEIYNIINRELPEGLFAYSPAPSTFYVTAELDSYAATISDCYTEAMQPIYTNMFVTTADVKIPDFEIMYFGKRAVGDLTLEERRQRILSKIRSQASCSLWDILLFCASYIPEGKFVQVVEYNKQNGYDIWKLDVSKLDYNCYLALGRTQALAGELADQVWTSGWNYLDPLPDGVIAPDALTQTEVLAMRENAYRFGILFFDYTFTADALLQLKSDLNEIIPVRSDYSILDNLVLADYFLTQTVYDVTSLNNINCIAIDPTSTATGITGKVRP